MQRTVGRRRHEDGLQRRSKFNDHQQQPIAALRRDRGDAAAESLCSIRQSLFYIQQHVVLFVFIMVLIILARYEMKVEKRN
jgi:hypothetical protein